MEKPQRESSWGDLPLDIQSLIQRKLDYVDIIRFRAACKNLHISDIKHGRLNLPWLCKLSRSQVEDGSLECKIYDPCSGRTFETWKSVENFKDIGRCYTILCSKQGWLIARSYLAGSYEDKIQYSMFMYHPYSKEFISLPTIRDYFPCFATFSSNPGSKDCQVFLLCENFYNNDDIYICSYCLYGDNQWGIELVDKRIYDSMCGFEYMKGQILCLFGDGIMGIYSLADKSWTLLDQLSLANSNLGFWLTKGEGDLLVAVAKDRGTGKCWTFYFDWYNKCWVQSNLLETSAIFITHHLATFARNDRVNTSDCNVHFFYKSSDLVNTAEPSHYSFAGMRKHATIGSNENIVFIEPPRIN